MGLRKKSRRNHTATSRAVVVASGADGDVVGAVVVEVADARHAEAKTVAVVKGSGQATLGRADLLFRLDGTVGVEDDVGGGGGGTVAAPLSAEEDSNR